MDLPPLKWYDTLSADAQKVMLSLQRKYSRMRDQMLQEKMKKELILQDPVEYYKTMYTRQFKSEPQAFHSSTPQLHSGRYRSPYGERTKNQTPNSHIGMHSDSSNNEFDELVQIKVEPPDSPVQTEGIFKVPLTPSQNAHSNKPFYSNTASCQTVCHTENELRNLVPNSRNAPQSENLSALGLLAANDKERENLKRKRKELATPRDNIKQRKESLDESTSYQPSNMSGAGLFGETGSDFEIPVWTEPSFSLGISLDDCHISPVELSSDKSSFALMDEELHLASQDLFISQDDTESVLNKQTKSAFEHLHVVDKRLMQEHIKKCKSAETEPQESCHKASRAHTEILRSQEDAIPNQDQVSHTRMGHVEDDLMKNDIHVGEKFNIANVERMDSSDVIIFDEQEDPIPHPDNDHMKVKHNATFKTPAKEIYRCQSTMDSYLEMSSRERSHTMDQLKSAPATAYQNEKIVPQFRKKKECATKKHIEENITKTASVGPSPSVDFIDVMQLSLSNREELQHDILHSQALSVTLVYSDDVCLTRCFHHMERAKVRYIAIKAFNKELAYHGENSVFLFACMPENETYWTWFKQLLLECLASTSIEKVIMNAKQFCIDILKVSDETFQTSYMSWRLLDPIIGSWLLNSDKPPQCLQDILRELGIKKTVGVCQGGMQSLHSDLQLQYEIMATMMKKLWANGLSKLFLNIETNLIPVLAFLEMQKILVNTETFKDFSIVLKKKLAKLEEKAFASAGHRFCINSHPQLRQVLYEELRLDLKLPGNSKIAKTSVAHQKSTSEATLTQLSEYHSLPAVVLEYRQLQKLKSTYVDGLMSCVRKGYLSTHWDQTAAATGRLTSYQPNIQAIPKAPVSITDYEDNFIIGKASTTTTEVFAREPFVSHPGHLLLAADFQQIELRLLAHLADDTALLSIFNNPKSNDIFIELTSQWLCKSMEDVTLSEREQTKRIVYSVMYGVGKDRLADYLKVSPDSAKSIMTSFLVKFPAVNSFTKMCIDFCKQHGYTCTLFNRKRLIPNINHSSPHLRAQAGRQAVNFCVQGSAADLCKAAMLKIQEQFNKHSLAASVRLLAQIHDELLFEVEEARLNTVKEIVRNVMEDSTQLCGNMAHLKVPIRVSLSSGTSWAHLKPLE